MDVKNLEPAERDPVKLRRTAFALLAFMVFGGVVLQFAYQRYQQRQAEVDGHRPSYNHAVRKNISFVTQGGEIRQIADLEGRVWLALTLTKELQPRSQATVEALRWLVTEFETRKEPMPPVVAFVLDVDADQAGELDGVLPDFPAEVELWRVAAGEGKTPVKEFLKNGFRFGIFPHLVDGEWVYDSNLMLLDQQAKVRGIPGGDWSYDFEKVAQMEADYAQARIEHPDKELIAPPMTTAKFRDILLTSITYLRDHPPENPEK